MLLRGDSNEEHYCFRCCKNKDFPNSKHGSLHISSCLFPSKKFCIIAVRTDKAEMELNVLREMKNNKKRFFRYIGQMRWAK